MSETILIIDDEETLRESLCRLLSKEGYAVSSAGSGEDALALIDTGGFDLVISDIILPGIDGIEVLRKAREKYPDQMVIMITAYASLETALEALRAGAYDYIMKPVLHEELKLLVRNALRHRSLQAENKLLKKQIERDYDFSHIIGESEALKRTMEEVTLVADTKSNVLITGETGTGKELIARAIHYNSMRKSKPFVPINCASIPENLLESELFGHVRGAFTGAVTAKKGLFEEANGGTVFLDEIGEMGTSLQAKLLRVIDDRQVRPVGGTLSSKVNLRFITATNKDLSRATQDGSFREDLYYRINTINIALPPLRERQEDIPLLARHFLERFASELGKPLKSITPQTMSVFEGYPWPGNVRELRNIIERAVLISDTDMIKPTHLPKGMKKTPSVLEDAALQGLTIEDYTKWVILKYQDTMSEQKIADMLGVTRKSLWEKRKRWGLEKP